MEEGMGDALIGTGVAVEVAVIAVGAGDVAVAVVIIGAAGVVGAGVFGGIAGGGFSRVKLCIFFG